MAILKFRLGSSSYGGSRLGSTSTTRPYVSSITRDRSASRDRGGYGSGYSSGAGSSLYSSKYSTSGVQDTPKGVTALASRFGDTKSTNTKSDASIATPGTSSAYTRTRSTNLQLPNAREPLTPTSPSKDDKVSRPYARTRTADVSSYSTKPDMSPKPSGNLADARSGYGSDYGKSGYGSSSSYGSKYSWTPSTYKHTYSRENSNLSSDNGPTGWRSRVYGNSTEPKRPTSLALGNTTATEDIKPAVVLKRPSAFQSKPQDSRDDVSEKRSSLPSPNAVKVLPSLSPADLNLRNKAPADYTSCSEMSDNDDETSRKTPAQAPKQPKIERDMRNRPLRYLNAVPDLPTRKPTSPSAGLANAPSLKLSEKLYTGKYDMTRLTPSPSKWLTDREDSSSSTKVNEIPSPTLPPRTPPQGCSSDKEHIKTNSLDVSNKECRKSVLNMTVDPNSQDNLRQQMEEKRGEFGRQRRRDVDDDEIQTDTEMKQNPVDLAAPQTIVNQKFESKPPLAPVIDTTPSKSNILERNGSKGRGDTIKRSSSIKKAKERQASQTSRSSSSSSSSDTDTDPPSQRSRNGSNSKLHKKNNSTDLITSKNIKGEDGFSNASSSSMLSVPKSPGEVRKSNSRNRHIPNGRASRNSAKCLSSKSSNTSDESSDSGQEGYVFSIAKSKTMIKKTLPIKRLTMAPTMVVSIDSLGERTSPDGKEISRNNSSTSVPANDSNTKSLIPDLSTLPNLLKKDNNITYEVYQRSENGTTPAKKVDINCNEESTAEIDTDFEGFQWPAGSPILKRRHSYFRTQWDTETETEMENWSDSSLPKPNFKMSRLPEENEDEDRFEWPSSPEMWKKQSLLKSTNDFFEWPPSPEPVIKNDPKFISFTTDIDALINEDQLDSFKNMEVKMGFSSNETIPTGDEDGSKAQTKSSMETDFTEEDFEVQCSPKSRARKNLSLFIGKLTNIDEILGNVLRPLSTHVIPEPPLSKGTSTTGDDDDDSIQEIQASDIKVHDAQAQRAHIGTEFPVEVLPSPQDILLRKQEKRESLKEEIIKAVKEGLDDATLQIYRDGDYSTYLDMEGSLAEQADDIDGLTDSKKNAIILRTQLSVRVHAIIEKLKSSEGRELRRALFSLKQIFQDDKDLVHAFVQHDGIKCLLKVGSSADHNYQTYILRALGQVMLYVDGMTGISNNSECIEWLYSLAASKFRLVTKTALKLLLVFVEYSETNALTLIKAIQNVDRSKGNKPWASLMRILEGRDCPDAELMIFTMTLINKTLNGVPDQDTYYDQSDSLEEQNLENLIQRYMHNPNSDLDLLQQLTIYEAVLAYEDGDDVCRTRTIDPTIRTMPRFCAADRDDSNRRRSRRHCTSPDLTRNDKRDDGSISSDEERGHVTLIHILNGLPVDDLGGIKHSEAGVTPALRRRRERAERQRNFLHDQDILSESRRSSQSSDSASMVEEENRKNSELSGLDHSTKMLEVLCGKREGDVKDIASRISALLETGNTSHNKKLPVNLEIDTSVKDILKKLSTGTSLTSAEQEKLQKIGDASGRIQKAKDGLVKSQQKPPVIAETVEAPKKSENDVQWENLKSQLNRPLKLADLDFTDLTEEDDVQDTFTPSVEGSPPPAPPPPMANGGIPAPPCNGIPIAPPMENGMSPVPPPPPPLTNGLDIPAPPPLVGSNGIPLAPPIGHTFGINLHPHEDKKQKTKKTIKLFWKELRDDHYSKKKTIWDSLEPIDLDTQKLEHLFESRAKDMNTKKVQDQKGIKEIIVLDPKRSNMINIGMTKLPPPRTIKTAILKMDSSIMNREGIEKLLSTMLPTAEEKQKIQEAASATPELPLGSAEQFLMMLSSISELPARLKLWLFKLDYENLEKEVADPLMDIKEGIANLQSNKTFKTILSILLSIGNFLNGSEAKGFHVDYLSKVPEVKDTVNKHSLLHHLCHFVHEKHPNTSDLYSEIGSITRASKVDFDELQNTIDRLEVDCKESWDHLKAIAKHDGPTQMKLKMSEFLADSAERIIVLGIINRRIMKRFRQFCTWMGLTPSAVLEAKPQKICSVLSEFALEYRTCRERVLQQIQKKANHRERNKTRGKMITEDIKTEHRNNSYQKMDKFKSRPKTKEEEADSDLKQLLNYSDVSDTEAIRGKNAWRRTREGKTRSREEISLTEGLDDALLDSLVKTATQTPTTRSTPRDRKRSRHADRKSLKRSRTRDRNVISELETLQALSEKRE